MDKSKADQIMLTAEINEKKSNQILDFTREIKNADIEFIIKVTKTLWSIIYSNKEADMYETNMMRRHAGLMYIDNKTKWDIKDRKKQGDYDVKLLGLNYRMTDFQAALGYKQIISYRQNLRRRHQIAKKYNEQ